MSTGIPVACLIMNAIIITDMSHAWSTRNRVLSLFGLAFGVLGDLCLIPSDEGALFLFLLLFPELII